MAAPHNLPVGLTPGHVPGFFLPGPHGVALPICQFSHAFAQKRHLIAIPTFPLLVNFRIRVQICTVRDDNLQDPVITPDLIAAHGLSPDEYDRILRNHRPGSKLYGTGHFLCHVE